ncbi:MAG TPA: hypothetical protein PL018_05760 [Ignavibacteriaceae bacterium]|nr:hypothetical protein [Ignavibacteriaceae bacterium]HRP94208.1 hypothetical protein [Ignavibacteriaceae bacterium]HRQ53740.1 hypothetical protein [Ignavibacteriaceae bacterium]
MLMLFLCPVILLLYETIQVLLFKQIYSCSLNNLPAEAVVKTQSGNRQDNFKYYPTGFT